jgi:AcrR family transcriptional regulator
VKTVPSGAFHVRDTRELLLAAMAELVAEHGYEHASPPAVAARAGVSRSVFALHFESKEGCLLAAYDAAAEQAFSAAAAAFVATPGSWAEATHAALDGLLEYAAATPTFARLAEQALIHGGERAVARRAQVLDLFMEFLEPGYAIAGEPPDAPRTASHLIGGAVYELLRRHVAEDRLAELPYALPEITLIVLSPFVGREEALRIATGPVRRS